MILVYKQDTGEVMRIIPPDKIFPEGMSDINAKLSVMEIIGGSFEDYGIFRLHDIENKEDVDIILEHTGYINLVFKDDKAVDYEVDYGRYDADKQAEEEQRILDSLIPSDREVLMAEAEIQTITILQEAGLI